MSDRGAIGDAETLARGIATRRRQRELRFRARSGEDVLDAIFSEPTFARRRAAEAVLFARGVHRFEVEGILVAAGVSEFRLVGELTERQARALAAETRKVARPNGWKREPGSATIAGTRATRRSQ